MKLEYLLTTENTFEGKHSYENVKLLLYRHWFILVEKLIAFLFFASLPGILYIVVGSYLEGLGLTELFWFLVSIYVLVWWYGLFYTITMYLLDTWIVTDHRIIDSEQQGFFRRTVSELNLLKIQDITVRIRGPIPTFFDFGELIIQTAGTQERFHFKQIPNPRAVKDTIMEMHNEYMKIHKDGREVHKEL
ncbi:MAG: PH domain-containing protein [Patescibacteria group bacterium]